MKKLKKHKTKKILIKKMCIEPKEIRDVYFNTNFILDH